MSWIFPVAGPNEWSKGSYGIKHHRGNYRHNAIDIYAPEGTRIVAPVTGKVIGSGTGKTAGNFMRIRGDDGITYYFAHMQYRTTYQPGDRIYAGSAFGRVGRTGNARRTKHHLHFSMTASNGKALNPASWLSGGVNLQALNPSGEGMDIAGSNISTGETIGAPSFTFMDPFGLYAVEQEIDGSPVQPDPQKVMRDNLRNVLNALSHSVAGGQRLPVGATLAGEVEEIPNPLVEG